jgi:hypothetical protein
MDRKVILEAARLGFLKQIDDLRARVVYVDQELAGKPIPDDIEEACYPAKSPKGRVLGKLAPLQVVPDTGKRTMSAAGKERIAAGQRRRWARYHRAQKKTA